MSDQLKENPFQSQQNLELISLVNDCLVQKKITVKKIDNVYTSERILSRSTNKITAWLMRLERFFKDTSKGELEDNKENTVKLIVSFLKNWLEYSDELKKYSCTEPKLFNCIVFSLMHCSDKSLWDRMLECIKSYKSIDKSTLILLDWFYDLSLNDQFYAESCHNTYKQLASLNGKKTRLKLADSPITCVYVFLLTSAAYFEMDYFEKISIERDYSLKLIEAVIPGIKKNHTLKRFEYYIPFGFLVYTFLANIKSTMLSDLTCTLLDSYSTELCVQFRIFKGGAALSIDDIKTKEYKQFLDFFLSFVDNRIHVTFGKEVLIGIAQMFRFYSPKNLAFIENSISKNAQNWNLLSFKLFEQCCFEEAYYFLDDFICYIDDKFKQEFIGDRLAFYCFFGQIDQWLSGSASSPVFNLAQQNLIAKLNHLVIDEKSLISTHFFYLADKIANRYAQTSDIKMQESCIQYKNIIKRFLNNKQKATIEKIFDVAYQKRVKQYLLELDESKQKKKKKTNITLKNTQIIDDESPEENDIVQTETIEKQIFETSLAAGGDDLIPSKSASGIPHQKINNNKLQNAIVLPQHNLKTPKIKKPLSVIETNFKIQNEYKTPQKVVDLAKKNIKTASVINIPVKETVMAPKVIYPEQKNIVMKAVVTPKTVVSKQSLFKIPSKQKLVIKKGQIPEVIWSLLHTIKEKFPAARFIFSGSGVVDLLLERTPNDFDILVPYTQLYLLNDHLKASKKNSEVRGARKQIVHCKLNTGDSRIEIKERLKSFVKVDLSAIDSKIIESFKDVNDSEDKLNRWLFQHFQTLHFNVGALFCELDPDKEEFVVFSYSDALDLYQQKTISGIQKSLVKSFEKDPTHLFCLTRYVIKYPHLKINMELQDALKALSAKWFHIFDNYTQNDIGNRSRITQAIRKVFERHSIEEVNEAFARLGVLELFAIASEQDVIIACSAIPQKTGAKDKFISWLIVNTWNSNRSKNSQNELPLVNYLLFEDFEQHCLDYTQNKLDTLKAASFLKDIYKLFQDLTEKDSYAYQLRK